MVAGFVTGHDFSRALEFLHFLKRRFWDLRVSVVIVESVGLIYN